MIAAARVLGENTAVGSCRPGVARPAPPVERASVCRRGNYSHLLRT